MATEPGFTIPGYDIVQLIGQGAFARVYLAIQRQYARQVAVKVLDFGLDDARLKTQFDRECAATGGLAGHPNILIVLDSGLTSGGTPYLTSAFCEQGSLADRLSQAGPLPVIDVLRIGVKLAGALDTAHRVGLVHRDVKPENVLLSGFGEPMLADWGIATITSRLATRVTVAAMTPNHAAPEVLESKPASIASDIYALGSTLYALLAGRPPFQMSQGQNILSLIVKVTSEPVPAIPRSDVPPALFEAITRAMAKDPAERWASAAELGHALQQVQYQLGLPYTELITRTGTTGEIPAVAVVFAQQPEHEPPGPVSPSDQAPPVDHARTVGPAGLVNPTVVRPGGVPTPHDPTPHDPTAPSSAGPAWTGATAGDRPDVIDPSSTMLHDRHAPVIERPYVPPPEVHTRNPVVTVSVTVLVLALCAVAAFFAVTKVRTSTTDDLTGDTMVTIRGGQGVGSGGLTGTAPGGQQPTVTTTSAPGVSSSSTSSASNAPPGTGAAGGAVPPRALDVQRTAAGFQMQWQDDNGGRYPFIYEIVGTDGKRVGKASFTAAGTKTAVVTEADTGTLDADAVYCGAVGTISSSGTPLWAEARCTDGTSVKVS